MWANYYRHQAHPITHASKGIAKYNAESTCETIRVAVIPLDDVEALVDLASQAITSARVSGVWMGTQSAARAALAAIGIPCKQRRARK